ncbi:MAG: hypothetical protein ACD_3C00047G0002 [uncultured bacterium (gcode 4)]|uniref:Lipoprotein n=1 Tax=uncultured bacterium (gcode 4) TaxID=1234023 RepID=K2FBN8_9BACT|nr:MAG: hypothetical protein ACD_3C00047G0002 [uncultured bacterium (gcode 4)]
MFKKLNLFLLIFFISVTLLSCSDSDGNNISKKENTSSEIGSINKLSDKNKASFDCDKLNDKDGQQYCNNNKLKLKVDELVYSQDIEKSIWKCWSFVKGNIGVYKNVSDCRLKIVLTRYFSQFNNQYNLWIKQAPISCDILKSYWEDTICKDTLAKIKKYNEFKKTESVYNEYKDIISSNFY